MTYTVEERQEIEGLRYASKLGVIRDVAARREAVEDAISSQKETLNDDLMNIKTSARVNLAMEIDDLITEMRTNETETNGTDETETNGDDDDE